MTRRPVRFDRVRDLFAPEALGSVVGPVERIEVGPMPATGFSGSRHDRLNVRLRSGAETRLVVKRTRLSLDWTAYRTGDVRGREAALLGEPALAGVWDAFHNPYLGYAVEDGEVGLLMEDLSDDLIPDHNASLAETQEDSVLRALSSLHARFWRSDALHLPWLTPLETRLGILNPRTLDGELRRRSPSPLFVTVARGWEEALSRLSPRARALVLQPPGETARAYADLPLTLLHGDPKLGNVALLPGGRVAAFDWAVVGVGPAAMDLGHYLAINAARLTRSKEEVMARYRGFLETELGERLPAATWERMVSAAVLYGATVLLWTKGLALESGLAGAEREWAWWAERLAAQAAAER